MRKLNTADLFRCARMIQVMGARERLLEAVTEGASVSNAMGRVIAEARKTGDQAAVDAAIRGQNSRVKAFESRLVLDLMDCATTPEAEGAIYAFLSGPFDLQPAEVAALPLDELVRRLKAMSEEEGLTDFFIKASKFLAD